MKFFNYDELYQLFKYYVAVGIGTALDFGAFTLMLRVTPLNYLLANAISFSLGTVVVYYIQKNWTFRCPNGKTAFVFGKYIFAVGVYYILTNLILMICISYFLMNPVLSKLIQICLTFFLGYIINKKFVFADTDS
jgi:putative flippase GtrA